MSEFTAGQIKDLKILAEFIALFCQARHGGQNKGRVALPAVLQGGKLSAMTVCRECAELLDHGVSKRSLCPLEPKPTCKSCHIHCYTTEYRNKIREIMAYSGRRMVLRGRLDYLWHYFIMS